MPVVAAPTSTAMSMPLPVRDERLVVLVASVRYSLDQYTLVSSTMSMLAA